MLGPRRNLPTPPPWSKHPSGVAEGSIFGSDLLCIGLASLYFMYIVQSSVFCIYLLIYYKLFVYIACYVSGLPEELLCPQNIRGGLLEEQLCVRFILSEGTGFRERGRSQPQPLRGSRSRDGRLSLTPTAWQVCKLCT